MNTRIVTDLSARLLAHAAIHGTSPTGEALDELFEQTAAATRSDSADVRCVYDRELRIVGTT